MSVEVLPLTAERVSEAAEVEKTCLETAWSARQLAELPPEAVYLTAVADGIVCGVGSMYCVGGEAELQNLAVLPDHRRRGVARSLLDGLFDEARKRGCASVFLEVDGGNLAAQTLYRKSGFR